MRAPIKHTHTPSYPIPTLTLLTPLHTTTTGTRPLLAEIQCLVGSPSYTKRVVRASDGFPIARLQVSLMCSVCVVLVYVCYRGSDDY